MINLRQSRVFKRLVIAVYWVALPVCLISAVGAFILKGPTAPWLGVAGALLGAAIVGWRLWLYRRALGVAGSVTSTHRVLLVLMPLGLLALVGVFLVLVGLIWIAVGVVATEQVGFDATGGWIGLIATSGLGLIVVAIGIAMSLPLVRLLCRPPPHVIVATGEESATADGPTA